MIKISKYFYIEGSCSLDYLLLLKAVIEARSIYSNYKLIQAFPILYKNGFGFIIVDKIKEVLGSISYRNLRQLKFHERSGLSWEWVNSVLRIRLFYEETEHLKPAFNLRHDKYLQTHSKRTLSARTGYYNERYTLFKPWLDSYV